MTAALVQRGVEVLHLLQRARVAVEQEALGAVVGQEPLGHHPVRHVVGHVSARRHDLLHLLGQGRVQGAHGPEHVTGRDGRDAEVGADPTGLRALAGAGWTHDQQVHQRRNPS
jgi:hypothetical protein